ncbi:hypothetical protein [Planobispora longispora]|uniref:Uncharacterized protein n=1 Tax=Planobispora longispora TaxID=28887 RepID=A0A8J3RWY8_9ACTN|nr:hypothetical protein [Planobispora longispora]BFE89363.1 hypothetical protein GCM10020093_119650 [Planobispora longispora]GIH81039.1 hypothetical protein Plo01_74680 [Planobispora longispora]
MPTVLWSTEAEEAVLKLPLGLRATVLETVYSLPEEPEPLGARPYGMIPSAFEIVTDSFTLRYTYGGDHVSVWVVRANT